MRTILLALLMTTGLLSAATATVNACGIPKPNPPPQCNPTPTPKPPTATPRPPTATPVPTVPPTATSVAQPTPGLRGVPVVPSQPGPAPSSPSGGSSQGEYCHFEPSTGNWELRHSTDVDRQLAQGDERPVAPGVCDQHVPPAVAVEPTPTPEATPEPVVETPDVPVVPEPTPVPPTPEPTPTGVPEIPEATPTPEPVVPVQIP